LKQASPYQLFLKEPTPLKRKTTTSLSLATLLIAAVSTNVTLAEPSSSNTPSAQCLAEEPPNHPYLADSPWPIMHRTPYAQASTCLRGPEPGDSLEVRYTPTSGRSASCWIYFSEKYKGGQRALMGGNVSHLIKASTSEAQTRIVDEVRVNWNWLRFTNWAHVLLAGNRHITSTGREILEYRDDAQNIDSPMTEVRRFRLPDEVAGEALLLNVTYDGWLAFNTDRGMFGVISPDFQQYHLLKLPIDGDEVSWHNQFAIDETGGIYIVTTKRMLRVQWNGSKLAIAWAAPYDFVGNGPTGKMRGSGTTPTLLGVATGANAGDHLVVVVDGHKPSNLVAFWRADIPANWAGKPGLDRRIAGIKQLAHADYNARLMGNEFQAIENSPVARGYELALAQYNGFKPECDPKGGVEKLKWDSTQRELVSVWTNDKINLNNVLAMSASSSLIYGSGRRNCINTFWALDWKTGEIKIELPLGSEDRFLDQGNGWQIGDERNLVSATPNGFIEIRPIRKK
jgi:hypothetical protein